MASSDAEIKDGFTISAWMKTKPTKEFDTFATSPPALEDTFFIRYPKTDILFGRPSADKDVPKVLSEQIKDIKPTPAYNMVKEKDWSKHTKPCQDVMHGIPPINTAVNSVTSKPKPAGVDDGFKGEGAACGTSIVKVAHKLISSKSSRGFTVASPQDDEGPPDMGQYNLRLRRGSKSLPVSPANSPPGSPNSRRRLNANRYFTSPFEASEESPNRSWLSMALLGFKRDLAASTSTLAEEDAIDVSRGHLVESVENLGPAPRKKEPVQVAPEPAGQPAKLAKPQLYRPKPSELREMNFWSPTSM